MLKTTTEGPFIKHTKNDLDKLSPLPTKHPFYCISCVLVWFGLVSGPRTAKKVWAMSIAPEGVKNNGLNV